MVRGRLIETTCAGNKNTQRADRRRRLSTVAGTLKPSETLREVGTVGMRRNVGDGDFCDGTCDEIWSARRDDSGLAGSGFGEWAKDQCS